MTMLKAFLSDRSGGVTIDWVALAAGVLLLGIGVVYAVFGPDGVGLAVTEIQDELQNEFGSPAAPASDDSGGGDECRPTSPVPCEFQG